MLISRSAFLRHETHAHLVGPRSRIGAGRGRMGTVDYRHFQRGWQYARLILFRRLGYPPSDREIASFLANDANALLLAGLRGSYETTASILQLRLAQLGSDSPT